MIDPSQDPQKLTFGQLLAQVSRMVGGRMREKMEAIGLHRSHGMILIQLWHCDGIPQNELARAMHIRPATVTHTLQHMERIGWIRRCRDDADQRIVRVYLTEKARDLHEEVRTGLRELDADMTAVLTDDERAVLRRLLLKIRCHMVSAQASCADGLAGDLNNHRASREQPR
jgi:DNA-binding MarR family transcriptional regulator